MHIETTTHEQGHTAKVYRYDGEFDVGNDTITWRAEVCHGEEPRREIHGVIPVTSPAVPAYAEKAVRDAIMQGIDSLASVDDRPPAVRRPTPAEGQPMKPSKPEKVDSPRVDNDPPLQGEGNYSAARRYDKAQREFVKAGKVEDAARKAKPMGPHEAEQMKDAEQVGREKAKR
jgi:hypothetical protein